MEENNTEIEEEEVEDEEVFEEEQNLPEEVHSELENPEDFRSAESLLSGLVATCAFFADEFNLSFALA